uniref:Reverse transcriptase domain-containing protein n=1 Tax=Tanacetum cinerariifolium TaxID=118510 RepID=A0A6L2L3W9_TANCI|nr:reverse transcriptase domain-containing protein [Tanacetum cinerariifolium]
MHTRSSSKLSRDQTSNPTSSMNPTPKGRIRRSLKQKIKNSNFEENPLPPKILMAENQTMTQLLQAPTNRACLHHGFSELDQLNTFYNALNVKDLDSLNSAAGGNFLDKMPDDCLKIIESKSKSIVLDKKNQYSAQTSSPTPTPIKAVELNCVTCDVLGTLPGNTVTNPKEDLKGITIEAVLPIKDPQFLLRLKLQIKEPSAPMPNLKPSIPYHSRRDNERRRDQAKEQIEKFYEIFKDMSFEISFTDALILMPKFTSTLKALIGNKQKLSEMARTPMNEHCLAVILNKLPKKLGVPGKFLIPCEFPGMDECLALADLGASINLMPLSVWKGLSLPELTLTCMTLELVDRTESKPVSIAKDVKVKVGVFHFPVDFVVVDFEPDPRVPLILRSNFLVFEEADAFLSLEEDLDSPELDPSYYNSKGDILSLEAILNSDPSPPLLNHEQSVPSFKEELKACEAKTIKSSIDEPPEVELKDLTPHLEYAFLEGDNKLPVIIAKALRDEEKSAMIKVLKSRKRAIAWKLSDI